MSRRFSAINCINNNINVVVDPTTQPMYVVHEVEVENADMYGKAECGNFLVDDEEAARLALSRALGQPEPVLYEDDESPATYEDYDLEAHLDALVTLDHRMKKGLEIINSLKATTQPLYDEYAAAKTLFEHAKHVMYVEHADKDKPESWWNRFNQLKADRDTKWNKFDTAKARINARLPKLWDHYFFLKGQKDEIAKMDKRLWPAFYTLLGYELNVHATWGGDDEMQVEEYVRMTKAGPVVEKRPVLDNRHVSADDAYADAHMEEEALYYSDI